MRSWVGVATLRSLKVDSVPEELQAEPLNCGFLPVILPMYRQIKFMYLLALVIRVLYRLRFLSEQAPFDVATFSYAYPLLGQVLSQGGIGAEEMDENLEQVALSLGIIKFHGGACV